MLISKVSDTLYKVNEPSRYFSVAFLPDTVVLYGSPGNQFFNNPDNLELPEFKALIKDRAAAIAAASIHLEGYTNRDKFLSSVEKLYLGNIITQTARQWLRAFIQKCDCAPSVIRKKLQVAGYGIISKSIEFEDMNSELDSTVTALMDFLERV